MEHQQQQGHRKHQRYQLHQLILLEHHQQRQEHLQQDGIIFRGISIDPGHRHHCHRAGSSAISTARGRADPIITCSKRQRHLVPSPANIKPSIERIEDECEAEWFLIDEVIHEMLQSDPACITPPSTSIKEPCDSRCCISDADGADASTKVNEHSIMELINWQRKASVM